MTLPIDLPDFSSVNILVLGDMMLDEYVWGKVDRISPEAPVPVVKVNEITYRLGGAGNVSANLAGLGCTVCVMGVVGKDTFGTQIGQLLDENNISDKSMVVDALPTTLKTRIMGVGQQLLRIDREDTKKFQPGYHDGLWQILKENLSKIQAVILSDYGKGVLAPALVKKCIDYCHKKHIPVFVDPKTDSWDKYRGVTCMTPNEKELAIICRKLSGDDHSLLTNGKNARKAFDTKYLLVTRGAKGMSLFPENGRAESIPSRAKEIFDVSGAGDTVIAVLTAAFCTGCTMSRAMSLANTAAQVAVSRIGTYPVTREELDHALRISSQGPRHKICSIDQATAMIKNWRQQGNDIVFTNGCFDLLHTGHIHLLQAAAKEGDRLIVGLNTDASIRELKGPLRPVLSGQDRAAMLAALECVDMVVLFPEKTPIELLRAFKPDVLVKGQDYQKEEIVGADLVEGCGGKVVLLPLEKGKSTSSLIKMISAGENHNRPHTR
jgi:D-beta-D-heptose 7-phosphate kinase/D-beta-D-heptose 1-phosphate adenosyltransferase